MADGELLPRHSGASDELRRQFPGSRCGPCRWPNRLVCNQNTENSSGSSAGRRELPAENLFSRPASRSSCVSPRRQWVRPLSAPSRTSWQHCHPSREKLAALGVADDDVTAAGFGKHGGGNSPVKAPSLLQETFGPRWRCWSPSRPRPRRYCSERGATTMSQCFAPVTSGRNEEKNARGVASVCTFSQLPAITRRRMSEPRKERINASTRVRRVHREERRSFVGEASTPGSLRRREIEGGAASVEMSKFLVWPAGLMTARRSHTTDDRVAAALVRGDGFGPLEMPWRESGISNTPMGHSKHGFGRRQFSGDRCRWSWTDIEPHPAVRGGRKRRVVCRCGIRLNRAERIDRAGEGEFLACASSRKRRAISSCFFESDFRWLAFRLWRTGNRPCRANEHGVGDLSSSFDDFRSWSLTLRRRE